MLSSVRQSKTHCYENDFTLPDVPSLLTVILDVIRALTVPRLNRSAISAERGGGGLTPSFNGNLSPFFIFSPVSTSTLTASVSHHIWNSLACCKDDLFILANGAIGGRPAETTKGGDASLFFGRGDKEMWLCFFIVCTATLPEDSHIRWIRFTSLHSFSRCLKCNVMTCRAERIFQSSSQKKKKKEKRRKQGYIYIKALDAICTDVFWMGGFTEQSIPSASHTWADVRGEVLLRPSHVRRDC